MEEIITSSNEVFKDFEFDIAVRIRMLGNPTRKMADINHTIEQTPGSQILTVQLEAKKSDM